MCTFSIIIPVYNTEEYITECLTSILKQSYFDFEVIIIDDGSTDNSGKICRDFINQVHDKRFSYYRIENSGVAFARNTGLMKAVGDYVCFVDSDDFADSNYLEAYYNAIDGCQVDMVYAGFRFFPSREAKTSFFDIKGKPVSGKEIIDQYPKACSGGYFPFAWRYCFRRDFLMINNLLFPVGVRFSEDTIFNINCFRLANSVVSIKAISYNYRTDNTNSAARINRYNSFLYDLEAEYQARKKLIPLLKENQYAYQLDIVHWFFLNWLPRLHDNCVLNNKRITYKFTKQVLSVDMFKDSAEFLISNKLLETKSQKIYYTFFKHRNSVLIFWIWKICGLSKFNL